MISQRAGAALLGLRAHVLGSLGLAADGPGLHAVYVAVDPGDVDDGDGGVPGGLEQCFVQ